MTTQLPENMEKLPFLKNGVGQIAMVVEDLDKTVENYWKTFGIGPWHFYTYGQAPTELTYSTYHGKPAKFKMRIALAYFGPTRIELIQHIEGETVYKDFVEKHGYGVQHLGIYVEDTEESLKQVKAAGFDVLMDGAGFGPDGDGRFTYLDTEDEFGITFELVERPKGRHTPEKIYPPEENA